MPLRILALNPSHDGGVAVLEDNKLACSIEGEKDSFLRHETLTASSLIDAFRYLDSIPDVVSMAGGIKAWDVPFLKLAVGYCGVDHSSVRFEPKSLFGGKADFHSCSHERSHLMCAYGMSPFEQGAACYALVWEGGLGGFYSIDPAVNIHRLQPLIQMPGQKYEFAYTLADEGPQVGQPRDLAGKVMALASYAIAPVKATSAEKELVDRILHINSIDQFNKERYRDTYLFDCGVHTEQFHRFARLLSDAIFDAFYCFAKQLPEKRPLLVVGGCGLNCEWNSRFRDSGLFKDVFVPPCANDSGIAIGAGVDALFHVTGNAKIEWSVYSGQEFLMDVDPKEKGVGIESLDLQQCAKELARGEVIAWVQGRCELGPRALGNRSLLASPLLAESSRRLNGIKGRESYRPVAPVCMADQISEFFSPGSASPHMLFLHTVVTRDLPGITHVDGSARLQTVSPPENAKLYALLSEFSDLTNYGVLCNTSLNFKGRGFINSLDDLIQYCKEAGIRRFVVNDLQGKIDQ